MAREGRTGWSQKEVGVVQAEGGAEPGCDFRWDEVELGVLREL